MPAQIHNAGKVARTCLEELTTLRRLADRWVDEMDFGFLYNADRRLFSIGYDVDNGALDHNFYDLLASEARLASLVAIGKGRRAPASLAVSGSAVPAPTGQGGADVLGRDPVRST